MKQLGISLFRKTTGFLYTLIGPNNSTKLSQSILGKKVFSLIFEKKRNNNIYSGSGGIKLKLSYDEALSSGFLHLGVINPYETGILKKVLRPGDVFVDIGAYVDGWHSIFASKIVGETGKIYTFEPVPEYYNKLSYNIKLNKLSNVILEKLAVADKKGKKTFYIGGLASTLYKKHLGDNDAKIEKIKVSVSTLDEYIQAKKISSITLIKIDAEGAELDVIRGAKKLLKQKDAPDLMIEVADSYLRHGNTTESELLHEIKKYGYKAFSINQKGLGKYLSKSKGRELMNVYFSKKSPEKLPIYS